MAKRVQIKTKPQGKGKLRKAAQQADVELQDAQSKHTAETQRPRVEFDGDCRVSGGALQGVIQETIARVYTEMWPRLATHPGRYGEIDPEIAEEAYILNLTIALGNTVDNPRKGLKVRDSKISNDARFCVEHS